MIQPTIPGFTPLPARAGEGGADAARPADERSEIGKRFEQMLWAEMLSHAGLEKSFTLGGGEAASAFSRYVVEAIAQDLAETHPMGLAQRVDDVAGRQGAGVPVTEEKL